jgi:hypothetical protein
MIAEHLLKNLPLNEYLITMDATLRKLAVTLKILAVLLSFAPMGLKIAFSDDTGGKIDLFTQKELYSGKGINMTSDAFGPGDVVVLYALVTYNQAPFQDLLVTYYVSVPNDTSFDLVAKTNTSGIAVASFTVPESDNQTEVSGNWSVSAKALIVDCFCQDTLTFKVDWIVKMISVRTIDSHLNYQSDFGKGGDVGLEIILRSIAMVEKNATISIFMHDELNYPIGYFRTENFEVQPNEKLILLYCKLFIPKWAVVGWATVSVSALTAPASDNGTAYCPSVSTDFYVITGGALTIAFHDAAIVKAAPSSTSVEKGQLVDITVAVRNEGTEIENLTVNLYLGSILIKTLQVWQLTSFSRVALSFSFNTSLVDEGNYTLTASIPNMPDEADLTDNILVDGIIEIKLGQPQVFTDIAITNVRISKNSLYVGESLLINVTVVNKGTKTETFDVSTYYSSSLIGTLLVTNFVPRAQTALTLVWNTSYVKAGFYQISASAMLPNDVNVPDNVFYDGIVQVIAVLPQFMAHDIAVLSVSSQTTIVYKGEVAEIYVDVKNQGNYTESFNVTAFYDSNIIGTLDIINLEPSNKERLVFHWDTKNVAEGNYTLRALASTVPGEENLENNGYVDGVVKVVAPPKGWYVPEWSYWLLLFILILVLIILLIVWLYCRRKHKSEQAFYSGWTAWYYGYDLRNRRRRTQRI